MPKTRKQKEETLNIVSENLKKAKTSVFANFQGLTVVQVDELRKLSRKEEVSVMAVKKTLLKKVFEQMSIEADPKIFEGGVAIFTSEKDEVAPARIVVDFAKTHKVVSIFGGILEGKYIKADYVANLASLPTKQQLLGQLTGTLNAPVSGFVNVLAGNIRNLVSILNNIKEAKA